MKNKPISVVIAVLNEEENISPLMEELNLVRETLPALDVLLIDDGSGDNTWNQITASAKKYSWCHGLRFPSSRGKSAAMLAGLRKAQGELIVTLDGDLQNDSADIPRIVEALGQVDVVCGYRADRQDVWSKRIGSRLANIIRTVFTQDNIRDTGCSLKGFHRRCLDDLPPLRGVHRFMPAWFRLHNRTITEIPVHHRPRKHGQSKYTNLNRLPQTIGDLRGYCWYRSRFLPMDEPVDVC